MRLRDLKAILPDAEIRFCPETDAFSPELGDIITDSRKNLFKDNSLFTAIKTQSGDGHRFISEMYRKNIRCFMVEDDSDPILSLPDVNVIVVSDTPKALSMIASSYRDSFIGKTIGITGSFGKTLLKELLYKALNPYIDIDRTPGSYNSSVGVPIGLLSLDHGNTLHICEAGIDGPQQMDFLAGIIRPDIGILTPITTEHDGGFDSTEQKIREKIKLFDRSNIIFYDGRDGRVKQILIAAYPDKRLIPVTPVNDQDIIVAYAKTVCSYLTDKDLDNIFENLEIISTRSDVDEGVRGCTVICDNFTNDASSILRAVDAASQRCRRDTPLIVICREPDEELSSLSDIPLILKSLEAAEITLFVGVGERFMKFNAIPQGFKYTSYPSESEFLNDFKFDDVSDSLVLIKGNHKGDLADTRRRLLPARHDTVLEVDLDDMLYNFRYFRSLCPPSTRLIAMVKASGYGVGAVEIASSLQAAGAAYLAVAVIEEGIALRKKGITMPIMVLNPITSNFYELFAYNLEPAVFSIKELKTIYDEARKYGVAEPWHIHLKLDTGMHRLGFTSDCLKEVCDTLITMSDKLRVSTVFSHLATADCPELESYTLSQIEQFEKMTATIRTNLPYPFRRHLLNTAGIMRYGHTYVYDFARLGIGLYGISPFSEENKNLCGGNSLKPIASLFSTIISLRHLPEGSRIGYGGRGLTTRPTVIATVPIGYADGIDRHFGCGATSFIVNGIECPTVGNICMDLCMIDVTDAHASIGDKVEIFGKNAPLDNLARARNTIPYEILTSISPRVKRVYTI